MSKEGYRNPNLRDVIMPYVKGGLSPKRIAEETGLGLGQVRGARKRIIRSHPDLRPTPAEIGVFRTESRKGIVYTDKRRRKIGEFQHTRPRSRQEKMKLSATKGGILHIVAEFADIGLSIEEIRYALEIKTGEAHSYRLVSDRVRKAIANGTLRPMPGNGTTRGSSPKRQVEARNKIDGLLSKEVQEELGRRLNSPPQGLAEKIVLAEFFLAVQQASYGNSLPMEEFFSNRWEFLPDDLRNKLKPQVDLLAGQLPSDIINFLADRSLVIPSFTMQVLLVEFYDARIAWRNGDNSLLRVFGDKLDGLSEEQRRMLMPYITAIRDATATSVDTRGGWESPALAVPGEIKPGEVL